MLFRGRSCRAAFLFSLLTCASNLLAQAPATAAAPHQDERRVVSPDGKIVFRLFTEPQEGYALSRLAYQIEYRGKTLVDTSYMGIDLWDQEPILGENTGLIGFRPSTTRDYNAAIASYMQNGSLGRRIDIEVRAYNEGIAFRYIVLRSAGVQELLIADEATDVVLAQPPDVRTLQPFVAGQPAGWLTITEILKPGFPAMHLSQTGPKSFLTRLDRSLPDPKVVYSGTAPYILPWRVVVIGPDRKCVQESKLAQKLQP